jgi:hypothetical protein
MLMTKVTEVSPPPKPTLTSNSSHIHDVEILTVKRELVGLDEFLNNMQGKTKRYVEPIMLNWVKPNTFLRERLEREAANEIASLTQAHAEEHVLKVSLEESFLNP